MAGEKYTNIGKARWENANVGVIKWDPENKAGLASVIDETTGTVYEIGGGGGGESDFSTATVTLNNTLGTGTRGEYMVTVPYTTESGSVVDSPHIVCDPVGVERENTTTLTVVLYKGTAVLKFTSGFDYNITPEATGNATYDEDHELFTITGECTITAAGEIFS